MSNCQFICSIMLLDTNIIDSIVWRHTMCQYDRNIIHIQFQYISHNGIRVWLLCEHYIQYKILTFSTMIPECCIKVEARLSTHQTLILMCGGMILSIVPLLSIAAKNFKNVQPPLQQS